MEIPQAAIEAAAAGIYERTTVSKMYARTIAEEALRAALPHLIPDRTDDAPEG